MLLHQSKGVKALGEVLYHCSLLQGLVLDMECDEQTGDAIMGRYAKALSEVSKTLDDIYYRIKTEWNDV